MSAQVSLPRRAGVGAIARRALQVVVALAFIAAAAAKLAGAPPLVALFDQIGAGQWFRYAVALIELAGAVLLLWPSRAVYGALLLAATMIGALLTHVLLIGGAWQPAAVLFALSAWLAWSYRAQLPFAR